MKTIALQVAVLMAGAPTAGVALAHEAAGHVHQPGDGLVHLASGGDGTLVVAGAWLAALAMLVVVAKVMARRG